MRSKAASKILVEPRSIERHELGMPILIIDTLSGENIGSLVNITVNGILAICSQPMDVNRVYEVELQLPSKIDGQDSIAVTIDCLWVNQGQSQELNWAGCAIIDAGPLATKGIESLIKAYSIGS
ncbi:hypothetical protein N9Z31_01580 [Pseudomonadales bacterium]|jgi:hypothetical protein|nr:hypothetical protein [Pseudomonadales bacterium]MDB4090653.1 hypothetical protein [Pseudomonadales bacterium]MDB4362836.1 hypothetical protein [Pseudomonadales bacterium]